MGSCGGLGGLEAEVSEGHYPTDSDGQSLQKKYGENKKNYKN
jgi:hypothetical protein